MKHFKNNRSFGRSLNQRRALLQSLARSLVLHGKITTTEPKAKELRPFIEKMITRGKTKSVTNTRQLITTIGSETGANKIINTIAPKYTNRNGGYTRIMKIPNRLADGSKMAIIEFV